VEDLTMLLQKYTSDRMDKPAVSGKEKETSKDDDRIVFDKTAFLARIGGDESLLGEILSLYINDVPKQMSAIEKSMIEKNTQDLQRQAHTLKGSSANVGALTVQAAALALEKACRENDFGQAGTLVPALRLEFQRFREKAAPLLCIIEPGRPA
jgi:HPt (histidine-containing phosphotransfer) domain-containing protein